MLVTDYHLLTADMDPTIEQSIANAVIFAITVTIDAIQTKYKEEILALREMIEKFLLLRNFSTSILPPNLDAAPKTYLATDSLSKALTERWNQANLGYFDPYLDRAHGEDEIVLVGKDVYFRNIVLFVQRVQSLVTFWGAAFVKANIATSFQSSVLEWYTSEFNNFDYDALNNN